MSSLTPQQLESWSKLHATVMSAALSAALLSGSSWSLAVASVASTGVLLLRRAKSAPPTPFGLANAITLLRFGLVVALGSVWSAQTLGALAALVATIFALDGLDGWAARRYNTSSAFGAQFDMETDALLVLVATFLLWSRGRLGAFILVPGALRYAYVLWLWAFPAPAGEHKRSRFGRLAFGSFVCSLVAALASGALWATACAIAGTIGLCWSFALSFAASLGRRGLSSRAPRT